MSFVCGDCHKAHLVPTREDDRQGQPCIDALARERDEIKLQIEGIQAAWARAIESGLSASKATLDDETNAVLGITAKQVCLCGGSGAAGATCPACGGVR